ncbi:hypothetical protein TRFO_04592 [Tritrichomonas foetus]|uniref:Uncharacterized protein n=1 Tax=Tritrichomonas foetus TaxID=1144522 RepID=A0A1J4KDI7_9EUKA|nr:hypothetical protein TRFO_04592 [Tritrichomonas foetus]|eukprot:OHT09497.1 hypothetical protein TRFO_04592 [Tritrichomonas foetus]
MNEDHEIQLEISVIDLLFELEKRAPKDIFDELISLLDINNKTNLWIIGRNLYHVCYGRPNLILELCDIAVRVKAVVDDKLEWSTALSISIITESEFMSCAPHESVFFYGFLCYFDVVDPTKRFLTIYKIFQGSSQFVQETIIIKTLIPLILSCYNIFKTKFPEFLQDIQRILKSNYSELFEELDNFISLNCDLKNIIPFVISKKIQNPNNKNSNYVNETNDIDAKIDNDMSENNLNDRKILSESHYLHVIIAEDDVDSLQRVVSKENFSIDTRVDISLLCCSELLVNKPTILLLSAFYGAIRCFKFLFLNHASVFNEDLSDTSNTIATYAVAGGNIEIIRILIQENIIFTEAFFSSISFHRNDLFYWFLDQNICHINQLSKDEMSSMHFAAESNNLEIALFLVESGVVFNFTTNYYVSDNETPLDLACTYDCIGIVRIICHSYPKIPKVSFVAGLLQAISSNSVEVFKFLIEFCKPMLEHKDVENMKDTHQKSVAQFSDSHDILNILNELDI